MKLFFGTLIVIAILVALMVSNESGKQSAQTQAPATPTVVYRTKTVHVPVAVPNDSAYSLRAIAEIEETRELRRRYRKSFGKDPIW